MQGNARAKIEYLWVRRAYLVGVGSHLHMLIKSTSRGLSLAYRYLTQESRYGVDIFG